jgi:hypothetical protein
MLGAAKEEIFRGIVDLQGISKFLGSWRIRTFDEIKTPTRKTGVCAARPKQW